jgi:hypothetical protein
MDTNPKEIMLLKDELNGYKFKEFLDKLNDSHKSYFKGRMDRYNNIHNCFVLLSNKRPPSIRLRYCKPSNLDENILNLIVSKYKEMYGEYADYQIIEK